MATLPKVLTNRADYQIGGGVALRLRTQGVARAMDFAVERVCSYSRRPGLRIQTRTGWASLVAFVRNSALIETRVVSPNCNFFRNFIKPAEFVVIHPFSSGDEACGALKDKRKLAPLSRH